MTPGKHWKAIAPLGFAACRAVKVGGLQRSKRFPHIRQTAGGQDHHDIPGVGTESMEYRPLWIEPIHDQDPSPLPNPALEPLGEATKGLEFAIVFRFGIGVRDIFAKFRRQGEREPIARDADRFQEIRSIPIGIHRPGHFFAAWLRERMLGGAPVFGFRRSPPPSYDRLNRFESNVCGEWGSPDLPETIPHGRWGWRARGVRRYQNGEWTRSRETPSAASWPRAAPSFRDWPRDARHTEKRRAVTHMSVTP